MIEFTKVTEKSELILIEQLANEIWREHYSSILSGEQIKYMHIKFNSVDAIENNIRQGFTFYHITYNNKLVGYVSIKKEEDALFLSKLYLLESYRGKNIGKQAIFFIENQAKNYGLNKIRLTVNKYNKNSIKFYEKIGFKNIKPIVMDIGNGFVMDDYVLEKEI